MINTNLEKHLQKMSGFRMWMTYGTEHVRLLIREINYLRSTVDSLGDEISKQYVEIQRLKKIISSMKKF